MLQGTQESNKSWREHWFVVNVIFEVPLVGSLRKKTLPSTMYDMGRCISGIAGGVTAMMYILVPTETDYMLTRAAKMTASMLIGMTAGKVTYNGLYNGGAMLYQYLGSKCSSNYRVVNDDLEMQAINVDVGQNSGTKLSLDSVS